MIKDMDVRTLVKINFLILGLGLSLYAIYYLKTFGLGEDAEAVLSQPTRKARVMVKPQNSPTPPIQSK